MTERIAWAPQPGPQTAAIACPVEELFYGGARGGGKTDFLLGDWAIHASKHGADANGLLIRRTLTEFTEIERRALKLFAGLATYNATKHTFAFGNGATLRLAYLDNDGDAMMYQGHQYTWLGVDEAGNFASPSAIDLLRGTLRSPAGVPCVLRLTGNPGGVGHHWLKARYIDPAPPFRLVRYRPQPLEAPHLWRTAVFIPSKLEDNPLLLQANPQYEAELAAAGSPALFRAWRFGDWDAIVGAVFAEWRSEVHVLPLDWALPEGWTLTGGLDWGYRAPGCFLLVACGPEGEVYGVDEVYFSQQTAGDVGRAVGRLCRSYGVVAQIAADEQMWYKTGVGAPTLAEEFQQGLREAHGGQGGPVLVEATHGRGSRLTKLAVTRRYLQVTALPDGTVPPWGWPRLRFHPRCRATIRTLPALPYAQGRNGQAEEDVDTTAEDHPYDALGAVLMSRPPLPDLRQGEVPASRHPGFDLRHQRRQRRYERSVDRLLGRPEDDAEGGEEEVAGLRRVQEWE